MVASDYDEQERFTNDELASIYDYLQGTITQAKLGKEMKKSRTNTYYYVGRAVAMWVRRGTLQFVNVQKPEDLGGSDL